MQRMHDTLDSGLRAMAQIRGFEGNANLSSSLDPNTLLPKRDENQPRSTPFCGCPSGHLTRTLFSDSGACKPSPEDDSDDTKRPRGQGPQGPVSTVLGLSRKENRRSLSLTCAYKQYNVVSSGNLFPKGRAVEKEATWGSCPRGDSERARTATGRLRWRVIASALCQLFVLCLSPGRTSLNKVVRKGCACAV